MATYDHIMSSLQDHIDSLTTLSANITQAVAENPTIPMDSFETEITLIETKFQAVQRAVTQALGGNSMNTDELCTLNYKYMECNKKLKDIRKFIAEHEKEGLLTTDQEDLKDLSPEDLNTGGSEAMKPYRQVHISAAAPVPNFLAPPVTGHSTGGALIIPPQTSPSITKLQSATSINKGSHNSLLAVSNIADKGANVLFPPDGAEFSMHTSSPSGVLRKSSNPEQYKKHAEELNRGINKLRSNLIALNRAANEPETITEALTGVNLQDARLARDNKKPVSGSESVAQITANLRRENISLKEELTTLKTRAKQQEDEIASLKKALSTQTKLSEKQSDDIDILQTSLDRVTEERQSLSATLKEKMRALGDLRKQLDTISDQNKELTELLEVERNNRNVAISELRAELSHYKTENDTLKSRLKTLDELNVEGNVLELERVTADIEDMQTMVKQLKKQKADMANKFAREKELLQENIDVLEAQLASGYLDSEKGAPSHAEIVMLEQEVVKRDIEIKRLRNLVAKTMSDKDEAMALLALGAGDTTDERTDETDTDSSNFRILEPRSGFASVPSGLYPVGRQSFLSSLPQAPPQSLQPDAGRAPSTLSMLLSQKAGPSFGVSTGQLGRAGGSEGHLMGRNAGLHDDSTVSGTNEIEDDDLDVAALVRKKRDKRLSVTNAPK
ncbi:Hypothetical protein GLP15_2974 [Giardia lamblia P15]|uniref:Uncharacterized protein n=1 Tax=Giardia intestinalis (strain P15) TaxID=658858 RepID=E1EYW2_GIAIA|nr:Hypothetical protein GLP15_2974 [Giardia lamblia P15]